MPRPADTTIETTRRGFLAGAGGLTFAVALSGAGFTLMSPARAASKAKAIGAWVRIAPDGRIVILTPAAEMGQGSSTGVPVVLAEELDADWSMVSLETAPAEPSVYGYGGYSMSITGSRAMRSYFDDMRRAGAQVRRVLMQAAARRWRVPLRELTTAPSTVVHAATGRRLSYGEIAAFATVPERMPSVGPEDLKRRESFRLIGHPVPRRDIPSKTDGSAVYSMDVHLPGMVYATVVHAPVPGREPESWNRAEVARLPGVLGTVRLPGAVAVVAGACEQALAAVRSLKVVWSGGQEAAGFDSVHWLDEKYAELMRAAETAGSRGEGDVDAALRGAAKVYRAQYRTDFAYHAQMEPLNAVARYDAAARRVEVWEGTQSPGRSRSRVAGALGLDASRVVHHQHPLGGGFGRRSLTDYTVEAALLSRAIRRPVKLIWTREEDVAHGRFRPQTLQSLAAAVGRDRRVAGWRHRVIGDGGWMTTSGINLDHYYRIPAHDVVSEGVSHGVQLQPWRAVAHPINLFAIEAMIDEVAVGEGVDPIAFRRDRVGLTPKAAALFDQVERMSAWSRKRPSGRALGVSVSERSGSLGAAVVEISLDRASGRIRVHEVWMAVDGGTIVQPDMARANIESGIVWGISSSLKERVTFEDGAVQQTNFHDYEILRMSEAPEAIHVDFARRSGPPTGLGEIGNPAMGGAIANAFHALTGKRLYHMPFTPDRVLAALQA